ncbi:MAG: hypothetical protein U9O53_05155 [archaeon]|nr:hypothetical protein [archaeon]
MLEIVLYFALFCFAIVSIGFMSNRQIYEEIKNKVADMKQSGNTEVAGVDVYENPNVDTGAINTEKREMHVNSGDIREEMISATQAIYAAIRDDAKLLGETGLDKAQTYRKFMKSVGESVVDSTLYHELGHIKSKASEVGAELYRSAVKGYGELSSKDKLDYAVSFYNLIRKGGEEGHKTAQRTYDALKENYGYIAAPLKDIVNAMLDSDTKSRYSLKKDISTA